MDCIDAMRALLDAMRVEVEALGAGDIVAIERATAAKMTALEAVQRNPLPRDHPEMAGFAAEGRALNSQAGYRVNLLLSGVEKRLGALSVAAGNASHSHYGRNGRLAPAARPNDLNIA